MKGQHPDILIIGGGVIGLTCAWYLAREGARVKVLDQSQPGSESSWAGAGILSAAPQIERASEPMDQLLAHSAKAFPRLSSELYENTGIDNGYRECGGVEILPTDEVNQNEHRAQTWRELGIDFEPITAATHQDIEPHLCTNIGASYFFPTVAQVRNPRHLKALVADCSRLNVEILGGCTAMNWTRTGSLISSAQTSQGDICAGRYLIASGAWSAGLLRPLGVEVKIEPVRGQIALLRCAAPLLRRVIQCGKRYLVPRPDGRVLIGSTEESVGFLKRTTSEGIQGLLRFGSELAPCLGQAEIEKCWAGLRPGSPDGAPYLGEVPGCDNLFLAAGHFRAGIQLSPATGILIKELILDQAPTISWNQEWAQSTSHHTAASTSVQTS